MNVPSDFENLIKLLILGDISVGKSNFLFRFIEDKYIEDHLPTIGFDSKSKIITLPNKSVVKLQIWDTMGQEQFMSINKSLLQKVHGIILLYDITDMGSFEHLDNWFKVIREVNENANVILVANKCDMDDKRLISEEEGNKLATKNNISFVEASAKENINVTETFVKIADEILSEAQKKSIYFDDTLSDGKKRKSLAYKKQSKKCLKCC